MSKILKVRKVRPLPDVLEHILGAIAEIDSYTTGMALVEFLDDKKTRRAVERCLVIISEASRDIPGDIRSKDESIDWRGMANAGNLYRHGYDHVDSDMIWKTVIEHLPKLKALAASLQVKGPQ